MKKIYIITGLVLLFSLLNSCNFKEIDGGGAHDDYLITGMYEAIELKIRDHWRTNTFSLNLAKFRKLEHNGQEINNERKRYGDTDKSFISTCAYHIREIIKSDIQEIKIEALTDFNKKFPKNSLLNPITDINYNTFLTALINEKGKKFTGSYSNWKKGKLSKTKFPLLLIEIFNDIDKTFMMFSFTEKPDNPNIKIKISITLGNGKILSTQKELTIKQE